MTRPLTLYLVAGEPSGDRLGAALMRALRAEAPGLRLAGIGGREMAAEGLERRFAMAGLSVMGLAEVVPRVPALLARIRATAADVVAAAPDALITIDSPGFGLRVARRVRARAPGVATIHYVAPSVWAWRPGRARAMARYIDHVLALLPFEPPHWEAAGVSCEFVGHPAVEAPVAGPGAIAALRRRAGVGEGAPLLLLAPGSRVLEVRRLMPVFAPTLARLAPRLPGLRVVIPLAEGVADEVGRAAARLDPAPLLIGPGEGEPVRRAAFAAADVALVKSGSIALELAAAGTPMVAAYRSSPLTAVLVRPLLRVDTASLVNLVAGARVVPEFIQQRCTPDAIAPAVLALLGDAGARAAQRTAFARVLAALGGGGPAPSARAARSVLAVLQRRAAPG
ncbi:MAG TPA: lipid-A-disaccharide synthase [Thermohalobaculum sp.]|nr:lipid-A-disaccharide synthase [Thermohalobaculum sp.]